MPLARSAKKKKKCDTTRALSVTKNAEITGALGAKKNGLKPRGLKARVILHSAIQHVLFQMTRALTLRIFVILI